MASRNTMARREEERHNMGAPGVSLELETMPPPTRYEPPTVPSPRNTCTSWTDAKERLRMLPVLLASGLAASIAVFRLNASASFALFVCELGMFALAVGISIPRENRKTD